jgi:hypothetical protein
MPLTAAITGARVRFGQVDEPAEAAGAVVAVELLVGAQIPAGEKNRSPAPVTMATRTVPGRCSNERNASPIAKLVAASIALAFGRSMVRTAMPSDLDVESGHAILLDPEGVDGRRARRPTSTGLSSTSTTSVPTTASVSVTTSWASEATSAAGRPR